MILRAPIGVPSCSVGGVSYQVKKGIVKVPDELGPELFAHGFIEIVPGDPTQEEIEAAKEAILEAERQSILDAESAAKELLIQEAANELIAADKGEAPGTSETDETPKTEG